jgi:hypothetical protein
MRRVALFYFYVNLKKIHFLRVEISKVLVESFTHCTHPYEKTSVKPLFFILYLSIGRVFGL